MEPEPASPEQSPLPTPAAMPVMLSRLSFCIAWLLGLEAFFAQSDDGPRTPRG